MPATNCVGFAGCGVPLNFTSVVKVCADEATAAATQNTATIQAIFSNTSFRINCSLSGFAPGKIAPRFVFLFTRDTSARRRTGFDRTERKPWRPSWTGRQLGPKLRNIICEARLPVNCERTCSMREDKLCGDSRPRLSDRAKLEGPYFVARTMLLGGAALSALRSDRIKGIEASPSGGCSVTNAVVVRVGMLRLRTEIASLFSVLHSA